MTDTAPADAEIPSCLHGRPLTDPVCPECAAMYPAPGPAPREGERFRKPAEIGWERLSIAYGYLTSDDPKAIAELADILAAAVGDAERRQADRIAELERTLQDELNYHSEHDARDSSQRTLITHLSAERDAARADVTRLAAELSRALAHNQAMRGMCIEASLEAALPGSAIVGPKKLAEYEAAVKELAEAGRKRDVPEEVRKDAELIRLQGVTGEGRVAYVPWKMWEKANKICGFILGLPSGDSSRPAANNRLQPVGEFADEQAARTAGRVPEDDEKAWVETLEPLGFKFTACGTAMHWTYGTWSVLVTGDFGNPEGWEKSTGLALEVVFQTAAGKVTPTLSIMDDPTVGDVKRLLAALGLTPTP